MMASSPRRDFSFPGQNFTACFHSIIWQFDANTIGTVRYHMSKSGKVSSRYEKGPARSAYVPPTTISRVKSTGSRANEHTPSYLDVHGAPSAESNLMSTLTTQSAGSSRHPNTLRRQISEKFDLSSHPPPNATSRTRPPGMQPPIGPQPDRDVQNLWQMLATTTVRMADFFDRHHEAALGEDIIPTEMRQYLAQLRTTNPEVFVGLKVEDDETVERKRGINAEK